MPRAGTGTCTTPAGQPVVDGTAATAAVFNALVADIYALLTDSLSRTGNGSMSVPLQFFDGTVAAPGIAFTDEPGSGLYRAGASDIRMSIAGVDVIIFASGGMAVVGTLETPLIDRAGTIAIGGTNGTTITIGRAGQVVTIASTLDAAAIDRAGTITIGGTNGTTITIGRSGQAQVLAGDVTVAGTLGVTGIADIAAIDRAGTIGIGTTNGTTLTIGRSGQAVNVEGIFTSPTITVDATSPAVVTAGSDWTMNGDTFVRASAGIVTFWINAFANNGSASYASIATIEAGYRPTQASVFAGQLISGASYYPCMLSVATNGVVSVSKYLSGGVLTGTLPAINANDGPQVAGSYVIV